ncbi:thiamine pyrophosphate-binding protein [Saccharopolyspora sp. NPDC050389]|uniref:thiamine pyrophosphate-binding protein n=1 Tax=Saccharopolyspora sp. NPDC050389 TaxID=3155516 RepID=UPI0033F206E3
MNTARSGGELVVAQLEKHGVTTAFCVPGESYLEVLDALHDSPIRLVVCRHEGGAAYMADADARLTGGVGVCLVTRGPGASNALVALHTAWQDRVPLLLLVGLIPRGERDREAFQEFDLARTFGASAKSVLTIDRADRIPEQLAQSFLIARSGRPGPVVVGLPEDMLRDAVEVRDGEPFPLPRTAIEDGQANSVAALIADARRPLVVLGGSPWEPGAAALIRQWAENWELPVVTDFRHQDLLDNESASYAGFLGFGRDEETARALADADVVIAVGTPLGDVASDGWSLVRPDTAVVSVLPDPEGHSAIHRPRHRFLATPAAFAEAMVATSPPDERPWAAHTRELRERFEWFRTPQPVGDRLDLGIAMAELQKRLPVDAVVTFGAGNHALWAQRYLSYRTYPAQLAPRNGSMGYGVPAAVAAAIRHPQRRVVSVAGDGCFLMNGQEFATAVAEGAAPVIVVVSNGMYGTIRQHQALRHPGRESGTRLVNPDFAAYARAFGGHGELVEETEQVGPALDRAFATGLPAIVELRIDGARIAPETTLDDLRK